MKKLKDQKRRVRMNYTPTSINNDLSKMKIIDLQRACIVRGLIFEDIGKGVWDLQQFFIKNYVVEPNLDLLDEFDDWRYKKSKEKGTEDEGFIRLGFIQEKDEDTGEIKKRKRPKYMKKTRKKRARNKELGIFSGTKKELTFICQKEGLDLKETTAKVIEKFPDAKEKSIRIWFNKAKKLNDNKE